MKQDKIIQEIEAEQLKKDLPEFKVGDTICVHQRIVEGDKERIQQFKGTVIARKGGGLSETVSLYRFAHGAGIERIFLIHSPKVAKIERMRLGDVRKSKLYYLRGSSGKASKVKELIVKGVKKKGSAEKQATPAVPEAPSSEPSTPEATTE